MRDIKFRLWDCDNESFSKIDFSDLERTIEELDSFRSYFSGSYFVGENYLQQFTGMKDKNGKEIYEGDICKFIDHPTNVDSCTTEVKFSEGNFIADYMGWPINNYGSDWIEIIGNIHTNPELLNEGV